MRGVYANDDSESRLDLIPIAKKPEGGPLDYSYDLAKAIRLEGAHGEEIVRDLVTDVHVRIPFPSPLFHFPTNHYELVPDYIYMRRRRPRPRMEAT